MKSRFYLFVILILLAGCSMHAETPVSTSTATLNISPSESPSLTIEMTDQNATVSPEVSSTPVYEVLLPQVIRKDGVTIEINGATIAIVSGQETTFRLGFTFTGLYEDQIPEHDPEDSFFLVKEIHYFYGEDEIPLEVEKYGGGGGCSPMEDGSLSINQSETYKLSSDFTVGQEEHIVVLVTFHEVFGIAEAVRFDLDVIPQQGPLG